ncbi:MAG: hypothetical protein ACREJO_02535 [Phycisphaerales bacterium]
MTNAESPASSNAGLKIAVLAAVIVLSLSFLVYRFWPAGTATPEVPALDAVDTARQQIYAALKGQPGDEFAFAQVEVNRAPDQSSLVVSGRVDAQAKIDEVNKRIKALNLTVPTKVELVIMTKR